MTTELPCPTCRHNLHGRCGVYHNPRRFREYIAVVESGWCAHYLPIPTDAVPSGIICDGCIHLQPGNRCPYYSAGCDATQRRLAVIRSGNCRHFAPLPDKHRPPKPMGELPADKFVTITDVAADAAAMLAIIPPEITAVIAVARSGLLPATIIATARHLPLFAATPMRHGVVETGNGYRLGQPSRCALSGPCLIVDDTASYGGTMQAVLERLARTVDLRRAYTAVVYADPKAAKNIDIVGRVLPQPHFLEWNFVNTFWAARMAFDFDGILCHDPPFIDSDERYWRFLAEAPPLYLPKLSPPIIVSARLESSRRVSLEWLARHGITPKQMILWDGSPESRWAAPTVVAEWKAAQLRRLRETDKIAIYAESDPWQAQVISRVNKIPVICPKEKVVYGVEYWKE